MSQAIQQFYSQFLEVIHHLGWTEAIDVAVVALVLYQVLRLLRGTQGNQVLVGLILLAVIGAIANQFNLVLLGWLFRNATFFIIIAVIVMFQPELRRALDQVGRLSRLGGLGRPLSGFNPGQYNLAISEAIRAAERLSSKHQGALIAFERSVGLEDYAATGVRINGVMVVSEETGSISVIEEGKITRNLDGDGLRRRVSPKVAKSNGFFR